MTGVQTCALPISKIYFQPFETFGRKYFLNLLETCFIFSWHYSAATSVNSYKEKGEEKKPTCFISTLMDTVCSVQLLFLSTTDWLVFRYICFNQWAGYSPVHPGSDIRDYQFLQVQITPVHTNTHTHTQIIQSECHLSQSIEIGRASCRERVSSPV